MRAIDRLCLDAVERLGPDVRTYDVQTYVEERRLWGTSVAAVYSA